MKNKKNIIAIILVIGAVISVIYGITAKPKAAGKKLLDTELDIGRKTTSSERIVPIERRAKKTRFKSWGKSPFVSGSQGQRGLMLSGIVWHKTKPKAIISSEVVGLGDRVGNYIVKEITQDKVVLTDGSKDYELKME